MNSSWQEYITVIFELNELGCNINNKMISEKLDISPPSVTEMIKKLKSEGLVDGRKSNLFLTEKGVLEAKKIMSKHRLWEYFLKNELGYDWGEVHEEAKALQYSTSDKLMNRLNKYLKEPIACPHGGYIFINSNDDSDKKLISLSNVDEGNRVTIERLADIKDLLEYMDRKKLSLGDSIYVEKIDRYDGSFLIRKEDKLEVQIGIIAAKDIFVSEI